MEKVFREIGVRAEPWGIPSPTAGRERRARKELKEETSQETVVQKLREENVPKDRGC